MSIRSIDMQVLIPKATEVGKQQNILTQQSTIQQQQFAEQMQKTAEARQHQVQGIGKNQGGKVERDDTRDKKQHRHNLNEDESQASRQELSSSEDSADDLMTQDPIRGHIIDIKT